MNSSNYFAKISVSGHLSLGLPVTVTISNDPFIHYTCSICC